MKKTQGAGRDRAWERSCGPAGGCGHEYSDSSNTSNQLSILYMYVCYVIYTHTHTHTYIRINNKFYIIM